MGRKAEKTELMLVARRYGWKGKSYRKAKRFDRALTRKRWPNVRPDVAHDEPAALR